MRSIVWTRTARFSLHAARRSVCAACSRVLRTLHAFSGCAALAPGARVSLCRGRACCAVHGAAAGRVVAEAGWHARALSRVQPDQLVATPRFGDSCAGGLSVPPPRGHRRKHDQSAVVCRAVCLRKGRIGQGDLCTPVCLAGGDCECVKEPP